METDQLYQPSVIPFVHFEEGQFRLTVQAQNFLRRIDGPLAIVSIAGKYRTGKSLFLNRVLLDRTKAFKVSPTVNSCTKGLWLCTNTIKNQDGKTIVIVDSEGFGASQQTDSYCNKILLLTLLVSSYFIYNSVGSIDEKSLCNLSALGSLAKDLQAKNGAQNLESYFPTFLWLVRDFTLQLVDRQGGEISPSQYLEQALELQKGTSDAVENKNKVRRVLKNLFPQRDCATLVRPVQTQSELQLLASDANCALRPEFVHQAEQLRARIFRKSKPKTLKQKPLSGDTLVELLKGYIASVNSGTVPSFDLSYEQIMRYEAKKALMKVEHFVERRLTTIRMQYWSDVQIDDLHRELVGAIPKFLSSLSFPPTAIDWQSIVLDKLGQLRRDNYGRCYGKVDQIMQQFQGSFDFGDSLESFLKNFQKVEMQSRNLLLSYSFSEQLLQSALQKLKLKSITNLLTVIENREAQSNEQHLTKQNNTTQQLKALTLQIEQLRNQVNFAANQNNKLQQQLSNIRIKYEITLKELQAKTNKIQETNYSQQVTNKQINVLRRNLYELQQQNMKLSEQLSKGLRELNWNKKQMASVKTQSLLLKQKNIFIDNTLSEKECALGKAEQRLLQIEEQFSVCRSKLEQQTKKQLLFTTENEMLKDRLHGLQQLHSYSQQQYDQLSKSTQSTLSMLRMQSEAEVKCRLELISSNRSLAEIVGNLQKRQTMMEKELTQAGNYRRNTEGATCFQCNTCSKFFLPRQFSAHVSNCRHEVVQAPVSQAYLAVKVIKCYVVDNGKTPETQYLLELRHHNGFQWTITKKYQALCQLRSRLAQLFPGIQFSESEFVVRPKQCLNRDINMEERKLALEHYLNDVSKHALTKRHDAWLSFIDYSEAHVQASNENSDPNRPPLDSIPTPDQFLKAWMERNIRQQKSIAHCR